MRFNEDLTYISRYPISVSRPEKNVSSVSDIDEQTIKYHIFLTIRSFRNPFSRHQLFYAGVPMQHAFVQT